MTDTHYYKILWIDDEYVEMTSFIDICKRRNITLIPCKYADEGMKLFEQELYTWDGVILDAKQLKDKDASSSLTGLSYCKSFIEKLEHQRYVPYYILTGQTDLMSDQQFRDSFGEFYIKANEESEEKLLKDIILQADKLPETQLRKQYSDIFSLSTDLDGDLLSILPYLDPSKSEDPEVFNMIRKVLEWVMQYCIKSGILLVEWNGSNLAECSKRMNHSLVPIGVQRSFHSCVELTNEGSHRATIDEKVRVGEFPYLIRSTIYELLNILHWCKTLPTTPKDQEKLRECVKENLLMSTKTERAPKADESDAVPEYKGKKVQIQQDNQGNCFYEDCLLPWKQCNGRIGEYVVIDVIEPNEKKKLNPPYKWYARRVR